jgi:hypothetical protein
VLRLYLHLLLLLLLWLLLLLRSGRLRWQLLAS